MLLLGIIVTGTHQARRTGNASTNGSPNKLASAVQAAVKALVAFPLLVRSSAATPCIGSRLHRRLCKVEQMVLSASTAH